MPKKRDIKEPADKVEKLDIDKKTTLLEKSILSGKEVPPDTVEVTDVDKGNIITLSAFKRKELENRLYGEISETVKAESALRSALRENHDMYEGIPASSSLSDSSHFELEDIKGIRSHYGTVAVQGKCARYMAGMFSVPPWFVLSLSDLILSNKIQEWLQCVTDKVMRLKNRYREVFKNAGIENVSITSLVWDRRTKPERGVETYTDLAKFKEDYPDAKSAGIKQEEYDSYVNQLTPANTPSSALMLPGMPAGQPPMGAEASQMPLDGAGMPGQPSAAPMPIQAPPMAVPRVEVKVPYKKDVLIYDFVRMDVINRSKFGLIPHKATFEKARGKFIELDMTWDELARGHAEGRYSNIDIVKSRANSAYNPETSEVDDNQDEIENKTGGDSQPAGEDAYKIQSYRVYRVMYNIDLNDDGLEEIVIFTFAYNQKTLIRVEWWDDNWFIVPHYIEKRANRFEGIGIIQKEKNIIVEGDEIVNLRLKCGKMVTSPCFKARKGGSFDPGIQKWKPGVVWWLENMDDVEQWLINVNFPELYQEEANLERKHELLTSMTAGLSGKELPQDPNAPGIKTAMLNREGSVLINEDIDTLREGVELVGYYILTMAAKYLPEDDEKLKYYGLTKEDLKISLEHISLHNTSMSHNTEQRKAEEVQFMQVFLNNPVVQQDMESARKITAEAMIPWGKDPEKILPTQEQLFQKQVDVQKAAIKQMQEEMMQKQEENEFRQHLTDLGLPPARAEARLKEWRKLEESQQMQSPEAMAQGGQQRGRGGRGGFQPRVPMGR